MTGWAYANYAARLDLEENSLTRVKNVHIFNRLLELDTLVLKQLEKVGIPGLSIFVNHFCKLILDVLMPSVERPHQDEQDPVFHRATRVHELPDPLRGLDLVQMSIPGEPQSGNGVQCPHFSVTCGKVQMLVEDDDSLYVRWADDLFQDCSTTPLDTLLQDGVKSLIKLDCL